MKIIVIVLIFISQLIYSQTQTTQSDFDKVIKTGELIINGWSIIKGNKETNNSKENSTIVKYLCVKNKLSSKLVFNLSRELKNEVDEKTQEKKELVIQSGEKECLYELEKDIWDYEIINTTTNEVLKKGQYKLEEEITVNAE